MRSLNQESLDPERCESADHVYRSVVEKFNGLKISRSRRDGHHLNGFSSALDPNCLACKTAFRGVDSWSGNDEKCLTRPMRQGSTCSNCNLTFAESLQQPSSSNFAAGQVHEYVSPTEILFTHVNGEGDEAGILHNHTSSRHGSASRSSSICSKNQELHLPLLQRRLNKPAEVSAKIVAGGDFRDVSDEENGLRSFRSRLTLRPRRPQSRSISTLDGPQSASASSSTCLPKGLPDLPGRQTDFTPLTIANVVELESENIFRTELCKTRAGLGDDNPSELTKGFPRSSFEIAAGQRGGFRSLQGEPPCGSSLMVGVPSIAGLDGGPRRQSHNWPHTPDVSNPKGLFPHHGESPDRTAYDVDLTRSSSPLNCHSAADDLVSEDECLSLAEYSEGLLSGCSWDLIPASVKEECVDSPLTVLLSARHGFRSHGGTESDFLDSSSIPESGKAAKKSNSSKKRKTREGGDEEKEGRNRGDEDDSHSYADTHASGTRRRKLFACPYLKKDPRRHRRCLTYQFPTVSRVKLHLSRCERHQQPIYCPRCYDTFDSADSRDTHNQLCQGGRKRKLEGITQEQRKELSKKSKTSDSEEERWYAVWRILFPDETPPDDPYIDPCYFDVLSAYWEYERLEGPAIFDELLHEQLSQHPSPFVEDWQRLQSRMFQEALRETQRRYFSTNSSESGDLPRHPGHAVPEHQHWWTGGHGDASTGGAQEGPHALTSSSNTAGSSLQGHAYTSLYATPPPRLTPTGTLGFDTHDPGSASDQRREESHEGLLRGDHIYNDVMVDLSLVSQRSEAYNGEAGFEESYPRELTIPPPSQQVQSSESMFEDDFSQFVRDDDDHR